jgi:hypothetical protein
MRILWRLPQRCNKKNSMMLSNKHLEHQHTELIDPPAPLDERPAALVIITVGQKSEIVLIRDER